MEAYWTRRRHVSRKVKMLRSCSESQKRSLTGNYYYYYYLPFSQFSLLEVKYTILVQCVRKFSVHLGYRT
jgi:hypothetical protein